MRAGKVLRENERSAQCQRTKMAALLRRAASSAGVRDSRGDGSGAVEGGKEDDGGARKLAGGHRAKRKCSSAGLGESVSRKNVDSPSGEGIDSSEEKLKESGKPVSVDPIIWQTVRKQIVSAPSSKLAEQPGEDVG